MPQPESEYKRTLFDRHGPAAGDLLRAWGYGFLVFCLALGAISLELGFSLGSVIVAAVAGGIVTAVCLGIGGAAGETIRRFTMGGSTTPYVEQYSYQQALVMQGRLDDALASFEAIVAEQPTAIDARLRAAELYARDRQNPLRAAELLREVQRAPNADPGQYVLATNRLVDLLIGPLNDPGRAQVELRKLIERAPGSAAAVHARAALANLKERPMSP
jgi:hypothetical protein